MNGPSVLRINWSVVVSTAALLLSLTVFIVSLLPEDVDTRLAKAETMIEVHEKRLDNLEEK